MAEDLRLHVHVGTDTRELRLPADSTLAALRQRIRMEIALMHSGGQAPSGPFRLIHAGSQLAERDDAAPLTRLRIADGAHIHVVVSQPSAGNLDHHTPQAAVERGGGEVDPSMMGFDRLRAVGLDDNDIAVLRATYLPQVRESAAAQAALTNHADEPEEVRMRRMEDAWIREQAPNSEFAVNVRPLVVDRLRGMQPDAWQRGGARGVAGGAEDEDEDGAGGGSATTEPGTMSSFMCGLVTGFLLGWIALLCLMHPRMSQRFKRGVIAGTMASLLWMLMVESPTRRAQPRDPVTPGSQFPIDPHRIHVDWLAPPPAARPIGGRLLRGGLL